MVVPSNTVDSMNIGGLLGLAATRQQSPSQDHPAAAVNGPVA
jgi:hypothetical protein